MSDIETTPSKAASTPLMTRRSSRNHATAAEDAQFEHDSQRDPRSAESDIDPSHPDAPQQARAHVQFKKTAHKPHELEYMRQQGVFTKLPDDVCDDLVRCYFQHVHFFLPVVDASSFLNEYYKHGPQNISLLLLWSMFLASANVSWSSPYCLDYV